MPPPSAAQEALEWFIFALRDLHDAKLLAQAEVDSPNAVWHAQQAVEKCIKALLVLNQIPFPWTHDLEALRAGLPPGSPLKTEPADLSLLSQRAMESRYPGPYDALRADEVEEAIRLAEEAAAALHQAFRDAGLSGDPDR